MNYLIYNGFWNDAAPMTVRMLESAAHASGTPLQVTPHTEWTARYGTETSVLGPNGAVSSGDTVLFWDKDVRLARALQQVGVKVNNLPDAIALCDDKSATHMALSVAGIPMPTTLVAPMAYTEVTDRIKVFLQRAKEQLGFPMVVKECFGSLGGQVYLAKDEQQLEQLALSMGPRPFLVQRFVSACAGEDWRLYVVKGKTVAAMHRSHPRDFRANLAAGGTAQAYQPTPEQQRLAQRCCEQLGLTFGAVDFLRNEKGEWLVCEVNSNAFVEGITQCTGVDVARHIIQAVFTNG